MGTSRLVHKMCTRALDTGYPGLGIADYEVPGYLGSCVYVYWRSGHPGYLSAITNAMYVLNGGVVLLCYLLYCKSSPGC